MILFVELVTYEAEKPYVENETGQVSGAGVMGFCYYISVEYLLCAMCEGCEGIAGSWP